MSATASPKSSDAVLERLMSLHPKVIDLSLERVERLLARLGHPERDLPPVVHVAGTNGKGSVIAYMRAALEEAGYRVHVYTSPHLVKFHERIRLAGELIAEDALIELLEECERVNGAEPITFFEITTVAAFLAYTRTPADVLILETGLGGRLDATNMVDRPAMTVITGVSIDHQQFLGETLAEIAGEKAGILKPGVPCVVSHQAAEAMTPIDARAAEIGAPLIVGGRDWSIKRLPGGFTVNAGGEDRYLPAPCLPGEHQIGNAATAAVALEHLEGFEVGGEAIARGLQLAQWPARFQRLYHGPLIDQVPDGWEVWLDGGHNEAAAEIIAAEVRRWREDGDERPLHIVFGMLNSKDPGAFLAPLSEVVTSARTLTIPGEENALPGGELAIKARALGISAAASETFEEAFATIIEVETRPARVLICGSLYLAGCVLAENG